MQRRRILIGVIGGDQQVEDARAFGRAVAQAGCILLTGGCVLRGSGEVKDAAMVGAEDAEVEGSRARLVGIIPSHEVKWDVSRERTLFLKTGLKHNVRNVINGLTPDVLVVFGGSRGTLAEMAFAAAAGRPLLLTASDQAHRRLQLNFEQYFARGDSDDVRLYLHGPVQFFLHAWERPPSTGELKARLADFLANARVAQGGHADWVNSCIAVVPSTATSEETGFPGLPGDPDSKPRFEEIIMRMSL